MKWSCVERTCNKSSEEDAIGTTAAISTAEKAGYLYTISKKSFLSREKWKKRYFALDGTKLCRYHKKEDLLVDSNCRCIGLECYDVHLPSDVKDNEETKNWKRDYVFFLVTSNDVSRKEARLVFSSESKTDLLEWVANLRQAVSQTRAVSRPQRPPRLKDTGFPSSSLSKNGDENGSSSRNTTPGGYLYNVNKYRAHGPKGRRLPMRKSRQSMIVIDHNYSSSLCQQDDKDEEVEEENDKDMSYSPKETKKLEKTRVCSREELAYQYSSSEDSNSLGKSKEFNTESGPVMKASAEENLNFNGNQNKSDSTQLLDVQFTVDAKEETAIEQSEIICDKRDIIGNRYRPLSAENGFDFYDQLATRLTTMKGSLNLFEVQIHEELEFIRNCLKRTLPSTIQRESSLKDTNENISQKEIDVLKNLYKAEDDLQRLAIITDKVKASLGYVVFQCNAELSKTSDL